MRLAAVPLLALLAAGCGSAHGVRLASLSPSAADATRAQWYADVKRTGAPDARPVLSESEVRQAVHDGADALGVSTPTVRYLPGLGGAADVVVEPADAASFATTAGRKLTTLLGPLADNRHAYLVTVADPKGRPLFVLGWAPGVAQGEGIAWQAPGIRSDAIIGQPQLEPSNKVLLGCRGTEPCSVMTPTK